MKVLEIKNNLYQPIGLILSDGTQLNIPKRAKRFIAKDKVFLKQIEGLKKKDKIKIKELDK